MNRQHYRFLSRQLRTGGREAAAAGREPVQRYEITNGRSGVVFALVQDVEDGRRQPVRIVNSRAPLAAIMIRAVTGEVWAGCNGTRRKYVNLCREMCAGERIPIPG